MDSCSSPVPEGWLLVFFQQLYSARPRLSPDRPEVFDTTACSYLTWAPALCVCTMPHESYSWAGGGGGGG